MTITKHSISVRRNYFVLLVVFIVFCNNLLWMTAIPFNQAPDELDHFSVCRFIAENGRYPVLGKDLNYYWMNRFTKRPVTQKELEYYKILPQEKIPPNLFELRIPYVHRPYVAYILSGALIGIAKFFSNSPIILLMAARFISALCGALTVCLAFAVSKSIFTKEAYLPFLTAIFIGALPQFTFVSSYVNTDAFTAFNAALVFFCWVRCAKSWSIGNSALLGLSTGLITLSKENAYVVILLTAIFVMLFLREGKNHNIKTIIIIGLGVLSCLLIRKYLLILIKPSSTISIEHFVATTPQIILDHVFRLRLKILDKELLKFFIKNCVASFWGVFGWMNITMPRLFYYIFYFLSILGIFGLVKRLRRGLNSKIRSQGVFALMIFTVPLLLCLSIVYSVRSDLQAQGRYFFPALVPIALGLCVGWLSLLNKDSHKRLVFISLCILLIGMNIFSFIFCIYWTYQVR